MNTPTFDELIRQRINELPPPPPRGWEALAGRLYAPPPAAAAATEVAADTLVADKLATLSPAAAPAGSWSLLQNKLDLAEAAAEVDEVVARGLNHAAPTAVSGWALLAARLETIGKRREMVGCMKVTEGAFLLSMLLLFVQFGPSPEGTATPTAAALAAALAADRGSTTVPTLPDAPNGLILIASPELSSVHPSALPTKKSSAAVPVAPLPVLPPPGVNAQRAVRTVEPTLPSAAAAPQLQRQPAPAVRRYTTAPRPALRLPSVAKQDPIRYYVNGFVSPVDFNQVVTQENEAFGIHAQTASTKGWSAGALIDITQGKNGLQTGLIYGYRAYTPAEILQLENVQRAEEPIRYGRLRYRTVSLPLNYERVLRRGNDWQLSAGLGAMANVILSSEFHLFGDHTIEELDQQIDQFQTDLQKYRGNRSGFKSAALLQEASRRDILHPSAGVLQGNSSIINNTSLYLSANVRVERIIDNRWSLYFSPTVTRLVTIREDDGGKGPLQDRIHNTMLRLGTRYRLTDK